MKLWSVATDTLCSKASLLLWQSILCIIYSYHQMPLLLNLFLHAVMTTAVIHFAETELEWPMLYGLCAEFLIAATAIVRGWPRHHSGRYPLEEDSLKMLHLACCPTIFIYDIVKWISLAFSASQFSLFLCFLSTYLHSPDSCAVFCFASATSDLHYSLFHVCLVVCDNVVLNFSINWFYFVH